MSVFIKGGYFAFSKQLLNITLTPTTVWHNGLVLTSKNKFITRLNPAKENKFELVYHGNAAALLLNNGIIYEDKKLFSYNLELHLTDDDYWFNKDRLAACVEYKFISCQ
jgi:hypothetical protein